MVWCRLMRGISPVIATVIIVSIAIALAIAVALWMAGITTSVSQFERLDITAAYVNVTSFEVDIFDKTNPTGTAYNGTFYQVILHIKNLGSSTATIDMIFVNNKPYNKSVNTPDYWERTLIGTNLANTIIYYDGVLSNVTDRTDIYIPANRTSEDNSGWWYTDSLTLAPGQETNIILYLDKDVFKSGQTVQIVVHTASGGQYPKAISLP